MMLTLFSLMRFSLGLGLSGTLPAQVDLAEHVAYLNSYHETYGWEGSISSPLVLTPEAEVWFRLGTLRGTLSYAGNWAAGDLEHAAYGDVHYRFRAGEAAGRLELVVGVGPIHLYAGPSAAYARLVQDAAGDLRVDRQTYTGWSLGAEGGVGVMLPAGKLRLGAEFYGRYQPTALSDLWFDADEGMLYSSANPAPGDRPGRLATTGMGIRVLVGLAP